MAITLKLQPVQLSKVDTTLEITNTTGAVLGDLIFSKGSVEWRPKSGHVNGRTYSWTAFSKVMGENGKPTKLLKKESTKTPPVKKVR